MATAGLLPAIRGVAPAVKLPAAYPIMLLTQEEYTERVGFRKALGGFRNHFNISGNPDIDHCLLLIIGQIDAQINPELVVLKTLIVYNI